MPYIHASLTQAPAISFVVFLIKMSDHIAITMPTIDLPEDVVVEILSKLPVKSLMRFLGVKKSWADLITSPDFISMHLKRSRQMGCLAVKRCKKVTMTCSIALLSPQNYELTQDIIIPCSNAEASASKIVGSINGVICFSVLGYSSLGERNILFNPATREFKRLPKPGVAVAASELNPQFGLGFGYDPATDDYKLVRIFHSHTDQRTEKTFSTIDMYSLNVDSWKRMANLVDVTVIDKCCTAFLNGTLYWVACRIEEKVRKRLIVGFDVTNETCQAIPLPDVGNSEGECVVSVLKGSLAMVVGRKVDVWSTMDVWLRKEEGVCNKSWTRLYKVGPSLVQRVMGFKGTSEVLFGECDNGNLYAIDPEDPNTVKVKISNLEKSSHMVNYEESLVRIKGNKEKPKLDLSEHCIFIFFIIVCITFARLFSEGLSSHNS